MEYDIFISCKSEDYNYGRNLYKFLQSNGIKPFLADQKLRELGVADYGKAIDDALEHSEHLVIVATKISYIEEATSPYVYYEWHTFSQEKKSGRKKGNIMTIVANKEMTNSLPIALRNFQSFLINDYKDIIGYIKPQLGPSTSAITDKTFNLSSNLLTPFMNSNLAIGIHSWGCLFFTTIACLILTSILIIPQKYHPSSNSNYDVNDAKCTPVDLDLHSGILWGDRNLGAKDISDFGFYYAWGRGDSIIYQPRLEDLCFNFQDAATKRLGKQWRIPTKEQIRELIDSCYWEVDSMNGHKGYRISSRKDRTKFIFLPAAGKLLKKTIEKVDTSVYYWSSDNVSQNDSNAYSLYFFINERSLSQRPNVVPGSKTSGRSIRPVYIME